jgi:predicted transcriptional regulator
MKLDHRGLTAGRPNRIVRDLLRDGAGSVSAIAYQLSISERAAKQFANRLLAEGLLEFFKFSKRRDLFSVTRKGAQFAASHLMPRINRAKADRLVAELLDRADAINANPDLLYRVVAIDAFGSYIRKTDDLGDVDVLADLTFKDVHLVDPELPGKYIIAANEERALECGRWNLSEMDRRHYGEIEVQRLLKARNPYIALASRNNVEGARTRRIYPREQTGLKGVVKAPWREQARRNKKVKPCQ